MKNYLLVAIALLTLVFSNTSCDNSLPASNSPTIITDAISGITFTTAISGGDVISDGGDPIIARGLCWSTNPNPTTNDHVIYETTDLFVSNITALGQHGGTYYVRAFATNSVGTSYGSEEVFDTWNLDDTKWAFLINYYNIGPSYPGDVDFYADGTTRWEELAYPGQFTTYGTWSVSGDIVTYYFHGDPAATSYIFTGTVVNNLTMSGLFTWAGSPDKTFSATVY